jgi:G protein-coupled receptor GPR1
MQPGRAADSMVPYVSGSWTPPQINSPSTAHIMQKKRNQQTQNTDPSGSMPPEDAHVILIVAATSAIISLVAVLASLRLFAMINRSFRQHLIMLLLLSDGCKALSFAIFPLVVFTRGHVNSSSTFCQGAGFFVALAIEASDFASLMIAIHLALSVFGPKKPRGKSGLWSFRRWVYPFWVTLPILAASLAFTNHGNAYVTVGTICYLPNQPRWYRQALSWIPRYIIILTLFSVGTSIVLHVHFKFKRFSLLGVDTSSYRQGSRRPINELQPSQDINSTSPPPSTYMPPKDSVGHLWQPIVNHEHRRCQSHSSVHRPESSSSNLSSFFQLTEASTWSSHWSQLRNSRNHVASAPVSRNPSYSIASPQPPVEEGFSCASRKHSRIGFAPNHTENSTRAGSMGTDASTEELDTSRHTIERHLRLLFIWPVVYTAVWIVPLISQCLQYTDKYALNQPYGLRVAVAAMLALQAGIDATVFTLREQPWKRPRRSTSLISVKKVPKILWSRVETDEKGKKRSTASADGLGDKVSGRPQSSTHTGMNWWEEEGKKRRDSIWMGTDTFDVVKIRPEREEKGAAEREERGKGKRDGEEDQGIGKA